MSDDWRSPILGIEFDWLAIDGEGFVGLFSTAGEGLAPREAALAAEAHSATIDELKAAPASTRALFSPSGGRPDDWQAVAERGVFCFDFSDRTHRYELVAAPEEPAHVTRLPESLSALLLPWTQQVRFREAKVLTAAELGLTPRDRRALLGSG